MTWEQLAFADAVQSRGAGASGLPQSEWLERGRFPVIGQGAEFIEGWSNREDLVLTPKPGLVLYGGHTRRAKYVDRPFVPGPNVKILEPKEGLEPKFLFHYLAQLRIESRGYADHFPEVRRCVVPLPPVAEQRRIAEILDKVGALCAIRREAIAKVDQLLQSVFLDLFGDPVTNPKGWPIQKFSDAVDFITGYPFKSERFISAGSGIKLCRGTNVLPSVLDWSDEANWPLDEASEFERFRIAPHDIIVAMDRPWIGSGFKIAKIPADAPDSLLVQRVARLRAKGYFTPSYLYALLSSGAFKRHCKPTETTVPHISPNDFRSFPIPDPGKNLMGKFEAFAKKSSSLLKRQVLLQARTASLLSSLQADAFAGKL